MLVQTLDIGAAPDAVPSARRFAVRVLRDTQPQLTAAAELAVSELVTNALLHAGPPLVLRVADLGDGDVRIEVHDTGRSLPVRPLADGSGMTGRGLALVDALASRWGVEPLHDGKVVWAELSTSSVADAAPGQLDSEALLASYPDWPDDTKRRYRISLGDVPTDLLLAAKAHVDSVIRELVLSANGAASGVSAALPPHLVSLVDGVVTEFSEARQAIKRQALAAAERGEARTTLELSLPLEAADAGERYLKALTEADAYARASRLLTLESPPQHQAFRRWYVTSLVDALRRAAAGESIRSQPSFESHLLHQVDELAELQRVSARGARLQRVTASLAAALSVEDAAELVMSDAVAELGAARGSFMLPRGGRMRALAHVGYDDESVERLEKRWAAAVDMPTVRAFRTGKAVWVETREERDEQFPLLSEADPGVVATCAVAMQVASHTVGVLRLSFLESRLFTDDERAFLEALAAVGAQALERVSLYEETVRTADQLMRLQAVASAFARTRSFDEALDVTITHAFGLVGSRVTSICLLDEDGEHVSLARIAPRRELPAEWRTFQLDADLPASEAVRTGELLWVATVDERNQRWPLIASADWGFEHGMAVLPLHVEDTTIGALSLSFAETDDGIEIDRGFLTAFADACAQALERARAADRAGAANRRLRLLAEASKQLAASLDVERTLASIARLAVPDIADWCVVHLLVNGELVAVAVEHVDAGKRELAREAQRQWPERLNDPGGVGEVVRSGAPILVPDIAAIPRELYRERSPEHTAIVRQLGLTSVIIVPLLARGRTLGSVTLITAESGHLYNAGDLAFAQDLAGRAAVAIDNASLFREASREDASRLAGAGVLASREASVHPGAPDHVLEAAAVGRFSISVRGETVEIDPILAAICNLPTDATIRPLQTLLDRVHPDDIERVKSAIARAVATKGEYSVEHRVQRPDGTAPWLAIRGRTLLGADGEPEYLAGIAYEPLQRDERDELARLLETMSDAFLRVDRDWRFTYVNTQAERVLFRGRNELLGVKIWDAFPEGAGSRFDQEYAAAIASGQPVAFEEFFPPLEKWFEVRAMPDPGGLSVFFHDVTSRRRAEEQRIVASDRLALLGEAARGLVGTLDVGTVMDQVTAVVVPRLADWAVVSLLDPSGAVETSRGVHRDGDSSAAMERLLEIHGDAMLGSPALSPVIRSGETVLWRRVEAAQLAEALGQGELAELLRQLGLTSVLVVPMLSGATTLGVLCLAKGPASPPFTVEDQATATDIGRRAGLALENARLYERQRTAAEVLQRSLLTPLPEPDHLQLAARYRPAGQEAQVGGDWYDAFLQPDGATVIAIGDVVGHDMNAAAAMGQLRNLLRGISYDSQDGPANVLTRVDHAIRGLQIDTLATAIVARIEQTPEARRRLERTLRWSNAGHPPPFLLRTSGIVSVLDTDDDMLLGLDPDSPRHDHVVTLLPGDTLILYTDGLVERRDSPIQEGLARLEDALSAMVHLPLEELCTELVARLLPDNADDDVALVAVRAFREDRPRPAEAGPENVSPVVPGHPGGLA
ncbi:MAG: Serine phosphatase RsbU, regulator of sigma subunit [Frankiales bacterium]|nr:Serine phosphatase RsbU, regulator of sigma subunit [Frankiales bacterium]